MRSRTVVIGLLFIALSMASKVHSQAAAATLFLYDEAKSGACVAKTIELPSKAEKIIGTYKNCPEHFTWTQDRDRFYYVVSGRLYEASATGQKASPKDLGPLPKESNQVDSKFWLDEKSNQPYVAALVSLEEKDVMKVKMGGKEQTVFKFRDKMWPSEGAEEMGAPYMAIASTLKKGKWETVEIKPTSSEACDTLGFLPLEAYNKRRIGGLNINSLLDRSTCAGQTLNCQFESPVAKKIIGEAEGYGAIEAAGGKFMFKVMWADSAHATKPVYFCTGTCKNAKKLSEITEDQLALAAADGYVLIANEYTNNGPRIYDAKTGALVLNLPKARSAVWVPAQ